MTMLPVSEWGVYPVGRDRTIAFLTHVTISFQTAIYSMGECFNCAGEASERYTISFESGKILKDKLVCESCISDFRDIEWMSVSETPVLMRGGDSDDREEDEPE